VAAIAGAGLRGWTIADGQEMPAFGDDAGMAWCVAFSSDGTRLVSGHEDGSVKVWETNPARVLHTYRSHRLVVLAVTFAPDGASVFSASGDGTIKRWKVPGR
jgi:WD40 repeat protein